jgi:hypothetical protein
MAARRARRGYVGRFRRPPASMFIGSVESSEDSGGTFWAAGFWADGFWAAGFWA